MADDTITRVVRALGSGRIHVADIYHRQLGRYIFISEFTGAALPIVTRCGAVLRCRTGVSDTQVTCPYCMRITQITTAPDDNTDLPNEYAA
jgi:hypothetical protein